MWWCEEPSDWPIYAAGDLQAQAADDRIVITPPGTNFPPVFFLSADEPRLVKSTALGTDYESDISHQEFEALAWEAAKPKRVS